jgi:sec-independent protein translocase protein TatA
MGFGGISIWQLLIVLAIVLLIFGTKRLKGLGGDMGSAIKSFKKAVNENDEETVESEKKSEDEKKAALEKKDAQFTESDKETTKKTDTSAH